MTTYTWQSKRTIVGGTSSKTWQAPRTFVDQLGIQTETVQVALAIAAMAFNVTVTDPSFTRRVNIAISKMAFNVSAGRKETASVGIAIGKMKFQAGAARQETVSGTIAIGAMALSIVVSDVSALTRLRQFTTFG